MVTAPAGVVGNVTGNVTGHASLDLPLTGGTLSGLLTVNARTVIAPAADNGLELSVDGAFIACQLSQLNAAQTVVHRLLLAGHFWDLQHNPSTHTFAIEYDDNPLLTLTTAGNATLAGSLGIVGNFAINTTVFTVNATTGATVGGTYNGQTISSAASFTGTLTAVGKVRTNDVFNVNGVDGLTQSVSLDDGTELFFVGGILTVVTPP